jgi:hypothetical protein
VSEPLDREEFSEEFPPTNQVAEIQARIKACQILNEFDKVFYCSCKNVKIHS